jgi:prepilin-type N-terminal cleavage/methylation domain-containing protein
MLNKLKNNQRGFTLTEVMIGMMILTVAIVTASNLLVTLMRANENNVKSLQAFYLAQEGIELVRNVRDTNWIHNMEWDGDSEEQRDLWGGWISGDFKLEPLSSGWNSVPDNPKLDNLIDLRPYLPEHFTQASSDLPIFKHVGGYLSSDNIDSTSVSTGFVRNINVKAGEQCAEDEECLLVTSTVTWKVGSKDQSLELQELLTNWKDGAL